MSEVANPHDRFVKEVLGRPDTARDFLANYLPPAVVACLDLSSLDVVKDSFVDPQLAEHLSDLLYQLITKHIFAGDLGDRLPGVLALMRDLARSQTGLQYVETLLRYVAAAAPQVEEEAFRAAIDGALADGGMDADTCRALGTAGSGARPPARPPAGEDQYPAPEHRRGS
ncbi:MAG: Rpn family recombination-promoting nuclease/putative transposase [Thermodesulfobacteriota bacterium]